MTNIETQKNWQSDVKNWKYKFFYFNPKDDRIMVPKRSEWAGITFNYAHKISWVWTIFLFLIIGLLIYTIYTVKIA